MSVSQNEITSLPAVFRTVLIKSIRCQKLSVLALKGSLEPLK